VLPRSCYSHLPRMVHEGSQVERHQRPWETSRGYTGIDVLHLWCLVICSRRCVGKTHDESITSLRKGERFWSYITLELFDRHIYLDSTLRSFAACLSMWPFSGHSPVTLKVKASPENLHAYSICILHSLFTNLSYSLPNHSGSPSRFRFLSLSHG
jgi:hypothetical protein